MAITDELRKWAQIIGVTQDSKVWELADHIDAAHRSALEKLAAQLDESEDGWVRLPVDADGVPIHIGDMLTDKERDHIGLGPAKVKCILYNDEGCVVSANDPSGFWYDPVELRHYHTPTVEDVLYESLRHFGAVEERTPEVEEWLHEQAAKLRLAGDGE